MKGTGMRQLEARTLELVCSGTLVALLATCWAVLPVCASEQVAEPKKSEVDVRGVGMIQVFAPEESNAGGRTVNRESGGHSPSALSMVARTGFWLGLIIVMLCGVVALARKFLPRPMGMFKSPAVELLGRSYLDAKRCIYLLKVGGRILVVGSSESGLSCLSEVASPDEVACLAATARSGLSGAQVERGTFGQTFARRVARIFSSGGTRVPEPVDERSLDAECDDRQRDNCEIGLSRERLEKPRPADVQDDADLHDLRTRVEGLKARLRAIS
jgi:flagellar biogenesis protein FliO